MLLRLRRLGLYYFILDGITRICEGRIRYTRLHILTGLTLVMVLATVTWLGAEWLTLRSGEYPGSLGYTALKFKYLMRLLCMETLVCAGLFYAAAMAQRAGKF
jgi:hypothetical protein